MKEEQVKNKVTDLDRWKKFLSDGGITYFVGKSVIDDDLSEPHDIYYIQVGYESKEDMELKMKMRSKKDKAVFHMLHRHFVVYFEENGEFREVRDTPNRY